MIAKSSGARLNQDLRCGADQRAAKDKEYRPALLGLRDVVGQTELLG